MWAVNNKTGVKFEMTENYYNRFFVNNPNIEKLAEKIVAEPKKEIEAPQKTIKKLKMEAKAIGVKGSDRMSREELQTIVGE